MNRDSIEKLLARLKDVRLIVLGDFFLDYYLHLERNLSEISIETGLEAYQVIRTFKSPGAAGTVVSNLRSLGVNVMAVGWVGGDGNGYDLKNRLLADGVDCSGLIEVKDFDTPTYMKPIIHEVDGSFHELNRLDTKHRAQLTTEVEGKIISQLRQKIAAADGVLVVDQVKEPDCGNITGRVRQELRDLAGEYPHKLISVDSRNFIELFDRVMVKSNINEVARAAGTPALPDESNTRTADRCGRMLCRKTGKPVVITLGENGIMLVEDPEVEGIHLPGIRVTGPVDIVGAGDSVNASIGAALCAGATLREAGILGNLVASIVIQQIGTTGKATPQQVLERFDSRPDVNYLEYK